MKRPVTFFISTLLILSALSCGKKGPILPPLVRIPQPPEDVRAIQRGGEILLSWKNPRAYEDGSPLSSGFEVEIWLLKQEEKNEEKGKSLNKEDFEKTAERIAVIAEEKFSEYLTDEKEESSDLLFRHSLKDGDFSLGRFVFGLKVKDQKGKMSTFSTLASVEPRILPFPPGNVQISVHEEHIEVAWSPPEKNVDQSSPADVKGYNIFRSADQSKPRRINPELVKEERFVDTNFRFGMTYRYSVRASVTDSAPFLESADSDVIEILTKDTFPPVPPSGLTALAGRNIISLSWESSSEEDLDGYRVWRREEGEEGFTLLTPQPVRETTYTDTAVEKNRRYYYAITTQDTAGNESPKSESVSEVVKDIPSYEDLSVQA